MANHGYLPRDGKQINADIIIAALRKAFNLSRPLAFFLTRGATTLLGQSGKYFCLEDLARHNRVEHDASIYHKDASARDEYAPITVSTEMLEQMFDDSENGIWMTPEDVARARVRREATYPKGLDTIHAEVARGEMAIVLNLFNNPDPQLLTTHSIEVPPVQRSFVSRFFRRILGKKEEPVPLPGVPISFLKTWMGQERLPDGWRPYHSVTLWQTIKMVSRMKKAMKRMALEAKTAPRSESRDEKSEITETTEEGVLGETDGSVPQRA